MSPTLTHCAKWSDCDTCTECKDENRFCEDSDGDGRCDSCTLKDSDGDGITDDIDTTPFGCDTT
jgi:hypothetical protein